MRQLFAIIALFIFLVPGATAATFSLPEVDHSLDEIAPHAMNYPPKFDSETQRNQIVTKLKDVILLLDAASLQYPNDMEILFRKAFANGMGHNMDFPNCAETSIGAYEELLKRTPEDRRTNYSYGGFLAGTTLVQQSIKYLQKAIQLGESDAHYTLAFVYMKLHDTQSALPEFKEYLIINPDNKTAQKMVTEIETGKVSSHIVVLPLSVGIEKPDFEPSSGS